MTTTYIIDANILLRFIRKDHREQSERAAKLIQRAMQGKFILKVDGVTVAEVFYALRSVYGMNVRSIARLLGGLLETSAFVLLQRDWILGALEYLQIVNVDFADAYLAALSSRERIGIASFDRDFDRFKGISRIEP